ncbi:MAG: hypothetical protein KDA57_16965 [Planctomycetales bacterium]|nr:hypothetical protein [Planctomycetales bacterium]
MARAPNRVNGNTHCPNTISSQGPLLAYLAAESWRSLAKDEKLAIC